MVFNGSDEAGENSNKSLLHAGAGEGDVVIRTNTDLFQAGRFILLHRKGFRQFPLQEGRLRSTFNTTPS